MSACADGLLPAADTVQASGARPVEAPRGLRGLSLFQPRVHPPGKEPALVGLPRAGPRRANEFAAGKTRCPPARTASCRPRTLYRPAALVQLKPRAVCGACRCSSRGFTRPGKSRLSLVCRARGPAERMNSRLGKRDVRLRG